MATPPHFGSHSGDSLPDLADGFCLAGWDVDPRTNRVHREGEVLSLEPKVMQVVLLLASHAGRPVTRDRIMETVWEDTIVTDDALTRCISEARKVFGREALETIPRVGYVLAAEVLRPQRGPQVGTHPVSVSVPWHPLARHPTFAPVPARWRTAGLVASAIVVAVAAIVWTSRAGQSDSVQIGAAVPATSLQGREAMATFSPDGSRIAYIHTPDTGSVSLLHVSRPGDSAPVIPYRGSRGRIQSPVWTPDGQDLLFVEVTGDTCQVRSVPALGGPVRDVMACSGRFVTMDLSPDGDWLAIGGHDTPDSPVRIDIVELATGSRQRIDLDNPEYHDYAPRFSPDGATLVFSRSIGEGWMDLYQYDLESRTTTRLTQHNAGIVGSDWLGDDNKLVYSMGVMGNFSLFELDVENGASRALGPSGFRPTVDRVGGRIVFETFERDSDLVMHRGDDSTPVCESTRHDQVPALLPSGDDVVFVSDRNGPQALYLCNLSGGGVSRIPHPEYDGVFSPSAGPDGRLSFSAFGRGRANIMIIDAPGAEPRQLTTDDANDMYPHWSSDGNWIYFGSDRTGRMEIWRLPPGGGTAQQITFDGGLLGRTSLDNAWLYFQRPGEVGLWRVAVDDAVASSLDAAADFEVATASEAATATAPPQLIDSTVDLSLLFAWRPHPGGLVIMRSGLDGTSTLNFLDPETGKSTPLRTFSGGPSSEGLATNDDLSIIITTRTQRIDSDLKMVEFR